MRTDMSAIEETSPGLIGTLLADAGSLSQFTIQVVRAAFRRPFEFSEIVQQVSMVGWSHCL